MFPSRGSSACADGLIFPGMPRTASAAVRASQSSCGIELSSMSVRLCPYLTMYMVSGYVCTYTKV